MSSRKRAVAYVRVSTDRQAREGLSLGEQVRRVESYIAAHELELVETFIDAGVSGRKADRPELRRLLARLAEIDTIVIPKLDRLGRNFTELARIKGELEAAHVALVCLDPQVDFSTPVGLLVWANLSAVAQFESHAIGERVSSVTAARAAEGKFPGGRFPPYGYRREAGRLVIVPAHAAVVKRIYAETVAGRSQRHILQDLNAEGIPTQNGARWTQGTIRRILAADVYRGAVEVKGVVHEHGQQDAIISPEIWAAVARRRIARAKAPGAGRGRGPAGRHLLTRGLLRCGCCGSAMSPRTFRKGREVYECRGRRDNGLESCATPVRPRAPIDIAVMNYFQAVALDVAATKADLAKNFDRRLAEVCALRQEADRQEARKRAELAKLEADYLAGALSAATFERMTATREPEFEAAEAEAARLREQERQVEEQGTLRDAEEETLRRLARIREAIAGRVRDAAGVEAVRAALGSLFDAFVLDRDGSLIPRFAPIYNPCNREPGTELPFTGALALPGDNDSNRLKFDSA